MYKNISLCVINGRSNRYFYSFTFSILTEVNLVLNLNNELIKIISTTEVFPATPTLAAAPVSGEIHTEKSNPTDPCPVM